jgi:DNA anti-recombination protein RmuC
MQKNLLVALGVCTLVLVSTLMFAQATQSAPSSATPQAMTDQEMDVLRADIREKRKKLTASNMTLTAEEAMKFWPIYDQYIQETIKINDDRWSLIKNYAANYKNMTDQVAQDYMQRSADVDQRLIALRQKYVPIFENAVSTRTTAQWYQVDRRLETMIELQQGSLIPIVDNK